MKILNITGERASGKTAAVTLLINKFGGRMLQATSASQLRAQLATITSAPNNNLAVDFDRKPSPALTAHVIQHAKSIGIQHLVLASPS